MRFELIMSTLDKNNNLVPIIGLEVHVELGTKTKMFCGCLADHFNKEPNTQVCPVCLGLPGALPVPNEQALLYAIKVGLALNCRVNNYSYFERKNYFYPDLPKGYQISQYKKPLCVNGFLEVADYETGELFKVRVNRAHQEEDTAKLVHFPEKTLIDFNRSGVPLLEIVTEPDFSSPDQVVSYLKELQLIIRSIGVSSADMEKGSMRLEANISLGASLKSGAARDRSNLPDYRVEIKNINSFRFVKKALDYEIDRQKELLASGQEVTQETRGYNEKTGQTFVQRGKEEAHDYHYFPEPDIPPLFFSQERVEEIKNSLPELPAQKRLRYQKDYDLDFKQSSVLTQNPLWGDFFSQLIAQKVEPREAAKIVINRPEVTSSDPIRIAEQVRKKKNDLISDRDVLTRYIHDAIKDLPKVVQDYQAGKESALQALIGHVMGKTKGKADPRVIVEVLKEVLGAGH